MTRYNMVLESFYIYLISASLRTIMDKNNFEKKHPTSRKTIPRQQNKLTPKLFVSGRLDRKKQRYTAKSLVLLNSIEDDIKAYCRGGELAILNYLIKEGLRNVRESNLPIHIDMVELENDMP